MKPTSFSAALAALLSICVSASATVYPLGFSINGTPFDRDDVQLPESPQCVYGLRVGLARAGHAEMAGLAVAAGSNRDKFAGGFQIAVFGKNHAEFADWGLWQVSPFGNTLEGSGGVVQLALYNEVEGSAEGLQAGFFNEAYGHFSGVQIGVINKAMGFHDTGSFSGIQIGLLNAVAGSSDSFSGIQIGLVNDVAGSPGSFSGIQIGLVNMIGCPPASCTGVQIGVANITEGRDWQIGFVPGLRVIF